MLASTGSTGYVSGSSGRLITEQIKQQQKHLSPHQDQQNKKLPNSSSFSRNPFGDSDTDEESVTQSKQQKQRSATDGGSVVTASSDAQSVKINETYRTPFD